MEGVEAQRTYWDEYYRGLVRFFSRAYLDDLLTGWQVVTPEHLEVAHARPDVPFKRVWRVAART